jgi:hypothetical protein
MATGITAVLLLAFPARTLAQGCSMCAQNASAAGSSGLRAIEAGIYTLLVPLLAVLGGIVWLTLRRRNQYREEEAGPDDEGGWDEMLPPPEPPVAEEFEEEEETVGAGPEIR